MSYVYLILDKKSEAVKIGKANNVDERFSSLQTGNPNELIILHQIKCDSEDLAFILEKDYHNKFSHLSLRGEWFKYDKEAFQNFFIEEINFKMKQKRKPLINQTLFGEEMVLFDINKHPRCYFYPQHVAQIYDSYEEAERLTVPFRAMEYPTHGKSLLLPYSNKINRVFISAKKHEENMELKRFKKLQEKTSSLESFFD
jgi:hypothetical protein